MLQSFQSSSRLTDEPLLSIKKLSHKYKNRVALQNVNVDVQEGSIFGILGPNGCGKSTLFKVISTLMLPSSGSAHLNGYDILKEPDEVRKLTGLIFQFPSLDRKLSIYENILYQSWLYSFSFNELLPNIQRLLSVLNLTERLNERVETLSGGLQRRVEVAKALVHRPRLLVLDEPSAGLDPGARLDFWELLNQVRTEVGTTILLTTHFLEEADRCDRVAIMDEGRIVSVGSPVELKTAIGGDILSISADDAITVAAEIESQFGLRALVVDGIVRIELKDAHTFIPKFVEALPGKIRSVTLSKPTLEDVFIKMTGHRFWGRHSVGEDA